MTSLPSSPFIFLDRDGTIIEERHFLCDPTQVVLCPGAAEGLHRLQQAGFRLVVVSNQSGIARGILTEAQVQAVNARMVALLAAHGIRLAGVFFCPHGPDANCACRKPRPGMVERAVAELGGDLRGAWVVGDRATDLDLGRGLGLGTILVRTGYGCDTEASLQTNSTGVVDDLAGAAARMLSRGD